MESTYIFSKNFNKKAIGVKIGGQMTEQFLKKEKNNKQKETNKNCDC